MAASSNAGPDDRTTGSISDLVAFTCDRITSWIAIDDTWLQQRFSNAHGAKDIDSHQKGLPSPPITPWFDVVIHERDRDFSGPCYLASENSLHVCAESTADAVAHETAHAFIHMLKPGFIRGTARIIHEAIADMTAVLLAYSDPSTREVALRSSRGDLRIPDSANTIDDTHVRRSVASTVTLDDLGFDPERVWIPDIAVPDTISDPHTVSIVLSSALYEIFRRACEPAVVEGIPIFDATETSAQRIGALMYRALDFCGEHRVSLEEYGNALLLADRLYPSDRSYPAETLQGVILKALSDRGILEFTSGSLPQTNGMVPANASLAAGSGNSSRWQARQSYLPEFRLDPSVMDSADILQSAKSLEAMLLQKLRSIPSSNFLDRFRIPLLFHRHEYSQIRIVDAESVSIYSDMSFQNGYRIIRLRYTYPGDPRDYRELDMMSRGSTDDIKLDIDLSQTAYSALLFDPDGALVAAHADRPLPQTFIPF